VELFGECKQAPTIEAVHAGSQDGYSCHEETGSRRSPRVRVVVGANDEVCEALFVRTADGDGEVSVFRKRFILGCDNVEPLANGSGQRVEGRQIAVCPSPKPGERFLPNAGGFAPASVAQTSTTGFGLNDGQQTPEAR